MMYTPPKSHARATHAQGHIDLPMEPGGLVCASEFIVFVWANDFCSAPQLSARQASRRRVLDQDPLLHHLTLCMTMWSHLQVMEDTVTRLSCNIGPNESEAQSQISRHVWVVCGLWDFG